MRAPTAPAVSSHRRPQFPTAGRPRPNAPRPRPAPVGGSRTERPATGSRGLHLQSPLPGAAINRRRRFRNRRPQFRRPAGPGPIALGRGHRSWVGTAPNARQLEVAGFACQAPSRGLHPTAPGGFAPPKAAVSNCRPYRAPPLRPRRPAPVGGNRTERPATESCGLHLPSPLAGAAINRRRRFRRRRPQFLTAGRVGASSPHPSKSRF